MTLKRLDPITKNGVFRIFFVQNMIKLDRKRRKPKKEEENEEEERTSVDFCSDLAVGTRVVKLRIPKILKSENNENLFENLVEI